MSGRRHFILGTAGHVDHGKSALVKALTGVETDRLKEERDRGISIELGFAELQLADGSVLGVVDVPGPAWTWPSWSWRRTRASCRRPWSTWRSSRCSACAAA